MRIIAGKYRHRLIKSVNLDTTRETQDSVREALFNSIGPYFDGGIALDLFCGSGALALEAVSRGIEKAYLNDLEPKAVKVAEENATALNAQNVFFSNYSFEKALIEYEKQGLQFDYIFLDPPYKLNDIQQIMNRTKAICKNNTLILFEMSVESNSEIEGFSIQKERKYGIKKIVYYKNAGENREGI